MNEIQLVFPAKWVDWERIGVLTFTDASFCNEKGYKSQQGRIHLADAREMKKGASVYRVYTLAFYSTTIKRVCRATLQAETYSLQAGLEAGDRIRALLCEMKGGVTDANQWDDQARALMPHLCKSDCRSLVDYVNSSVPAKTQDKRLGIELASIRQSVHTHTVVAKGLRKDNGRKRMFPHCQRSNINHLHIYIVMLFLDA